MPSMVRVKFKVAYDQFLKDEYTYLPEKLVSQDEFKDKVIVDPEESEAPVPASKKGK